MMPLNRGEALASSSPMRREGESDVLLPSKSWVLNWVLEIQWEKVMMFLLSCRCCSH